MSTSLPDGLPARVLVVRLGALGDVVNSLVFASALKAAAPEVRLGWVVHEQALPLIEGHPAVDQVHLWPRTSGLLGFLSTVRELRRERYGLAVDLQRLAKSALLARLSGAARVLGADRRRTKELAWLLYKERLPAGDPDAHVLPLYLEFARHLGVPADAPLHAAPADPLAARWADELCAELGVAPLVLHVGASKPANRWPAERFGALAAGLARDPGGPVLLVGGPEDRERAQAALAASAGAAGVQACAGDWSLPQLSALLARARLYVGADSGPLHLAAARGATCLALFGAADERRTGPFGARHVVLRESPACAPCRKRRCPRARHDCMLDLEAERVLQAARELLARPGTEQPAAP